jgi:hypothetical protein
MLSQGTELKYSRHVRWGNIASSPISEEGVATLTNWITHCDAGHLDCSTDRLHRQIEQSFVPTRLVKLEDHLDQYVRLVSPSGPVRYIALSYCWGTSEQSRTLRANIQSRERQLEVAQLPQTLKDAILMTRSLGIQYLWIDSLCIVQDNHEEWAIESSKMADIYSSAWLVVAATLAPDCASGFLNNRNNHFTVASEQLLGKTGEVIARRVTSHDHKGSRVSLAGQPLGQRAWVHTAPQSRAFDIPLQLLHFIWTTRGVLHALLTVRILQLTAYRPCRKES